MYHRKGTLSAKKNIFHSFILLEDGVIFVTYIRLEKFISHVSATSAVILVNRECSKSLGGDFWHKIIGTSKNAWHQKKQIFYYLRSLESVITFALHQHWKVYLSIVMLSMCFANPLVSIFKRTTNMIWQKMAAQNLN